MKYIGQVAWMTAAFMVLIGAWMAVLVKISHIDSRSQEMAQEMPIKAAMADGEDNQEASIQELPEAPDEVIRAEIRSYTSRPSETDGNPFMTASGSIVHEGTIACPIRYPFGTEISAFGKRYACEDRMAARYRSGNYFDVWMPTVEAAKKWGVKRTEIEIYLPN